MFQALVAILRIAGLLMHRISFNEGMRAQIARELLELEGRLENTKRIVKTVEGMSEDDIDNELRG